MPTPLAASVQSRPGSAPNWLCFAEKLSSSRAPVQCAPGRRGRPRGRGRATGVRAGRPARFLTPYMVQWVAPRHAPVTPASTARRIATSHSPAAPCDGRERHKFFLRIARASLGERSSPSARPVGEAACLPTPLVASVQSPPGSAPNWLCFAVTVQAPASSPCPVAATSIPSILSIPPRPPAPARGRGVFDAPASRSRADARQARRGDGERRPAWARHPGRGAVPSADGPVWETRLSKSRAESSSATRPPTAPTRSGPRCRPKSAVDAWASRGLAYWAVVRVATGLGGSGATVAGTTRAGDWHPRTRLPSGGGVGPGPQPDAPPPSQRRRENHSPSIKYNG